MPDFGLILCAAGSSTRMGRPKQLLAYAGRTLLRRAVETALASGCRPIVVVVGSRAAEMREALNDLEVTIVVNDDWESGMGGSIRAGLAAALAERPDVAGVIVMLCDQPHVTPGLIEQLIAAHRRTGRPACACGYDADAFGPPCLFAAAAFDALRQIPDAAGAKRVLSQLGPANVELVTFPQGLIDVDTPEDYKRLRSPE